VGPLTLANLHDLTADVAFLGCDGLTVEGGLTTPHMLIAEVGSALAASARRVVVLADASKLGRVGFTPIVPLDAVNVLVTDERADPDIVAQIRAAGIEVLLA
ncbi:MAG: DeoR/GlpR family DNA-binding transcription regulator, partial [Candidatus Dormibacteria bacterium]